MRFFNKCQIINLKEYPTDNYMKYLKLLAELTTVFPDSGYISQKDFENQLNNIKSDIYLIIYDNDVIGSGSYIIEPKFIHNLGSVAHIEDIIIKSEYRGLGLGKDLIDYLINIINIKYNVYKIILDCDKKNIEFYNKCGFVEKSIGMALYNN